MLGSSFPVCLSSVCMTFVGPLIWMYFAGSCSARMRHDAEDRRELVEVGRPVRRRLG